MSLVVLDHVFGWPSGGYIGVDVFFVISGFVITNLILREIERSGSVSLPNFYRRRARRILPAASTVIAATVLASAALLPSERVTQVWEDALAATFFGANWRMAAVGADYFQNGLPSSPLEHFWSLSIEEQFYFVWPVLIVISLALALKLGLRTKIHALWIPALGITVLSLAWSILRTPVDTEAAYFSSFTRFWELGFGVCLALVAPRLTRLPQALRPFLAYLGLGTIVGAALVLNSDSAFPGWRALIPVVATALVLAAGTGATPRYDHALVALTNPVSRYVGDRSYSIYLWHLPLIVLAPAIFPPRVLLSVGIVAATVLLSEVTYRLLEDPVRRSTWLARSNSSHPGPGTRRATSVMVILIAVLTTVGVGIGRVDTQSSPSEPQGDAACVGASALMSPTRTCTPPSTLTPGIDHLQSDTNGAFSNGCYRSENGAPTSCVFGSDEDDATSVALIGDSHAAMYIAALHEIAAKLNWRVTTYVGWGCTWAPHDGQPCAKQTDVAQADFVDDTPYDLIISAGSRKAMSAMTTAEQRKAAHLWEAAARNGSRIVALESVAIPSEASLQCIQRVSFDPRSDRCETPRKTAFALPDAIAKIAAAVDGAHLLTTEDLVCNDAACPAAVGGVIVFRDTFGHLTGSYIDTMAPFLEQRLSELSPPVS